MTRRFALVIGSDCDAFGQPLRQLESEVTKLYEVLTSPDIGQCVDALGEMHPLLQPTVDETKKAIRRAVKPAAKSRATLIVTYTGHGRIRPDDRQSPLYLLPRNAPRNGDGESAVDILRVLQSAIDECDDANGDQDKDQNALLSGLVLLVDACYSSSAVEHAELMLGSYSAARMPFEVLSATGPTPAFNCCFTREVGALLETGIRSTSSRVYVKDIVPVVRAKCFFQAPTHVASLSHDQMFLGQNRLAQTRIDETARADVEQTIARLTKWFVPTRRLASILAAIRNGRFSLLFGPAGSGRSTLAAAVCFAQLEIDANPLAVAAVFCRPGLLLPRIATALAAQLSDVDGFASAVAQNLADLREFDQVRNDQMEVMVLGPLRRVRSTNVCLVIDGIEQAPHGAEQVILDAILTCERDPLLHHVRWLVTASKKSLTLPGKANAVDIGLASAREIAASLRLRGIEDSKHKAIISKATGHWGSVELAASAYDGSGVTDQESLAGQQGDYFRKLLVAAALSTDGKWRDRGRPLLAALLAAGPFVAVPFGILTRMLGQAGVKATQQVIRDTLGDYASFVRTDNKAKSAMIMSASLAEFLTSADAGEYVIDRDQANADLLAVLDATATDAPDAELELARAVAPTLMLNARRFGDLTTYLSQYGRDKEDANELQLREWVVILGAEGPEAATALLVARARLMVSECRRTASVARAHVLEAIHVECCRQLGDSHVVSRDCAAYLAAFSEMTKAFRDAERRNVEFARVAHIAGDKAAEVRALVHAKSLKAQRGRYRESIEELGKLLKRFAKSEPEIKLTIMAAIAGLSARYLTELEARYLFEGAENFRRSHAIESGPAYLQLWSATANWYNRTRKFQYALELLADIHDIHLDRYGERNATVLHARQRLAELRINMGADCTARIGRLVHDALAFCGDDSVTTWYARKQLAESLGSTDPKAALEPLRNLLRDIRETVGPTHPLAFEAAGSVAFWTSKAGYDDEAATILEPLADAAQKSLSAAHPVVLSLWKLWASHEARMSARRGLNALQKVNRLFSSGLPGYHQETWAIRLRMADSLARVGEHQKAVRGFEQIVEKGASFLGAKHKVVVDARAQLTKLDTKRKPLRRAR